MHFMKLELHKVTYSSFRLPLFLSTVPAGFSSPIEGEMEATLDLNELLITHPAATFFVRVQGDSMIHANIQSGDVLIVDRALEPKDKSIVIAVLNGEFTVKRIKKKGKKIFLCPENSKYPSTEITEESDFSIWGTVSYVIHKAK